MMWRKRIWGEEGPWGETGEISPETSFEEGSVTDPLGLELFKWGLVLAAIGWGIAWIVAARNG